MARTGHSGQWLLRGFEEHVPELGSTTVGGRRADLRSMRAGRRMCDVQAGGGRMGTRQPAGRIAVAGGRPEGLTVAAGGGGRP